MSNINASVKSASAAYFTFDHIRKTIVGSEYNFKMAGNPTKAQYDALMAAMELQPKYKLEPIASTKKVEKKQSYKGLTCDLIVEYVGVFGNDTQKAELEKELNNKVNRRCNCDDANTSKVVEAAQEQLGAIRTLRLRGVVQQLPGKLQQAILAREENPEASLSELAAMMEPPISKPAMNHRLKKLLELAKEG